MLSGRDEWWTDDRVQARVHEHFMYSHLALYGDKLQSRVFSTSFSEDTYLQFILKKTRRLFLILVTAGIAGSIFDLVDSSYDDEDLPIAEENLSTLRLPKERFPNIEQTFYRLQFRFILRIPSDGEHIRYARSEVVPLQSLSQKALASTNASEQVKLPTERLLLRRRIVIEEYRSEIDILSEIAATNPLKHEHVLSVFASYQYEGSVCVLISPSTKYNLKSFLSDLPKPFEALPKPERRQQFLSWSSCLANAMTWLHSQGINHGAVRPSRILLDDRFQPSLGQFEGEGVLGSPTAKDDLEAYQYGAPEFWRRELTIQNGGATRPSGGSRLGRSASIRQGSMYPSSNSNTNKEESGPSSSTRTYAFAPTAKGNGSRLKLEFVGHQRRISVPSIRETESRIPSRAENPTESTKPYQNLYRRFDALSLHSSHSSENGKKNGSQPSLLFTIPVEDKATVMVQTWKSAARDLPMADIFALAAVIMDVLTVMCGRTPSSFAKHRSSKNRQAGRGGGLADASFHANLSTLPSWAESLHKDAEKKMKKDEGKIFRAVGPTLQVVLQCLDRDPSKRLDAESLAKHLLQHMETFASIKAPHCTPRVAVKKTTAGKQTAKAQSPLQTLMVKDKYQAKAPSSSSPASNSTHDTINLDHLDRGSVIPESFRSHRPSALQDTEYQPTLIDDYDHDSHYYDPHPAIRLESVPLRGLSPKPLQIRSRVRIEPSILEGDYSVTSSPPSLISRTTATHYSQLDPSEPGTPVMYSQKHSEYPGDHDQSFPGYQYLPPDRELPPVPANTPQPGARADSATRRQNVASKQTANVDHATSMLAEAINTHNPSYRGQREQQQFHRPMRKSSKTPYTSRPRYYINEDEQEEEDFAIYDPRRAYIR